MPSILGSPSEILYCNSGLLSFSEKSFHLPFPRALSKPSSVRKSSPHKLFYLKVQGHSFPKADLGSPVGGAGGRRGQEFTNSQLPKNFLSANPGRLTPPLLHSEQSRDLNTVLAGLFHTPYVKVS